MCFIPYSTILTIFVLYKTILACFVLCKTILVCVPYVYYTCVVTCKTILAWFVSYKTTCFVPYKTIMAWFVSYETVLACFVHNKTVLACFLVSNCHSKFCTGQNYPTMFCILRKYLATQTENLNNVSCISGCLRQRSVSHFLWAPAPCNNLFIHQNLYFLPC